MNEELKTVIGIAKQAGEILSKYFNKDLAVEYKQDEFDPVTQADKESDVYIRHALTVSFPTDEILSEENDARPSSYKKRVWMVDPLDGTKDFVGGRASFAVMIGLLDNNVPKLGVIFNPITNELFYAAKGGGAFREYDGRTERLHVTNNHKLSEATLVVRNQIAGDIRPLDEQVNNLPVKNTLPDGSIGLKLGRIAQGKADVSIHTNIHGCKWDTLAAEVIITEAGGIIADLEGNKLDYTKETVAWDKYFVATNNEDMLRQVLDLIKLPS